MLGKLIWKGFSFLYGFLVIVPLYPIAVLRDGIWFGQDKKTRETEKNELDKCKYSGPPDIAKSDMQFQIEENTGASPENPFPATDTTSTKSRKSRKGSVCIT